jgi:hypothetical protein
LGGTSLRLWVVLEWQRSLGLGKRTLRDQPPYNAHPSQLPARLVRPIRLRLIQRRPAQEASSPISLPRLVILTELVEVDRPVRLVQRIRPFRAAIVCQPGRYRYACAGEEQRLAAMLWWSCCSVCGRGERGREEVYECGDGSAGCAGACGDYLGGRERVGVRDAEERRPRGHNSAIERYLPSFPSRFARGCIHGGSSSWETEDRPGSNLRGGYVMTGWLARTAAGSSTSGAGHSMLYSHTL